MSSTAIDFPSNRSQLDPSLNSPPYDDVPLLDGDIFVAAGSSYTWTLDTGETYGRWRNEDPGATGDGRYVKLEDAGKTQVINGGGVLSINDKITLNGGNGAGTFDGTIKADGGRVIIRREGGDASAISTFISQFGPSGSTSNTFQITGDGSTKIGPNVPSTTTISLNADGSASFAGEVKVEGPSTPAGLWSGFSKYGSLLIGTTSENIGDARVSIDAGNGSATFAGGGTFGSTTKIFDTSGGRNVTAGLCRSNGGQSYGLTIAPADNENNFTAFIKADGSASFEGAVDFGSYNAPNDTNGIGAKIYPTGNIYLRNDDGPVIRGYNKGVSGPTSEINADGSAEFSGQLVAGKVSNSTKYFRWRDSDGVTIYDNVATGSSELFKVISNDGSSLKTQISFTANGSASFSGNVDVRNSGYFRVRRDIDDTSNSAQIAPDGTALFSNGNIQFQNTGGATFTGAVEANGGFTVNGVGVFSIFQALRTAVDSATNFDDLKAAMQQALSDFGGTPTPQPAPTPTPTPEPTPDPTNLIPDDWTHIEKLKALKELITEMDL